MPQAVLDTLDSIISWRERCAKDCLLLIDISGMGHINARHARMIGKLREIRDILANSPQIDEGRPAEAKEDNPGEQGLVTRLATMSLTGLEDAVVDEAVAELHPDPNEWLPDYLKPKVPKREPPVSERPLDEFSLLPDDDDDDIGSDALQMAAWCFLRDMDSLRAHLRTIWEGFRDGVGSTSLIVASFATSQAVQIVKGLEADLSAAFGSRFSSSCEYVDVISAMLNLKTPGGDVKIEDISSLLDSSIPDEMFGLFMVTPWLALRKFGGMVRPGFIPSLKPDDRGSFDPSRDRTAMSSQECKDEDFCLLMNHLPVVYLQTSSGSGCDHTGTETETLAEHALIHDFPPFINDPQKRIPVHLVFQWDVWKDIVLINRSNLDTCLGELHKEAHTLLDIARTWIDNCDDKFYNSSLMRRQIQLQLVEKIEQWIFEDPLDRYRQSSECILSDTQRHFLYNPWACGMANWRIMIYVHRIQVYIINHTQYLSSALQFYHALRQYEKIDRWSFLDGLFAICSPLIFGGSEAPKKGDLFLGHLISTGKDLTNLRSLVDQDYADTGSSTNTIPVDICCPFLTRLCEDLEFELTDQVITELFPPSTPGPKHYDPCSLLLAVKNRVHEDLEQTAAGIMMDLFGIQRMAITIIDRWHSRTSPILKSYFGDGYLEEDSQLPFVVSYLFVALDDPHSIAAETPESTTVLVEEAVRTIQEVKDVVGTDGACLGALGRWSSGPWPTPPQIT